MEEGELLFGGTRDRSGPHELPGGTCSSPEHC